MLFLPTVLIPYKFKRGVGPEVMLSRRGSCIAPFVLLSESTTNDLNVGGVLPGIHLGTYDIPRILLTRKLVDHYWN
jgi:hypothetical protein